MGWLRKRLMKMMIVLVFAAAVSVTACSADADPTSGCSTRLWYERPAERWTDALPIGNGRMGAMVFSGVGRERLQFNEYTLWTDKPRSYVRRDAVKALPEIRRLVAQRKKEEAARLANEMFLADPPRESAYQPCGDLDIALNGVAAFSDYWRELDLGTAVVRSSFTAGDVRFERETFTPYHRPALIVHRISADKPGAVAGTVRLTTPHTNRTDRSAGAVLGLDGVVGADGVRFSIRASVAVSGAHAKTLLENGALKVSGADALEIRVTAATNAKDWKTLAGDPAADAVAALARDAAVSFRDLKPRIPPRTRSFSTASRCVCRRRTTRGSSRPIVVLNAISPPATQISPRSSSTTAVIFLSRAAVRTGSPQRFKESGTTA